MIAHPFQLPTGSARGLFHAPSFPFTLWLSLYLSGSLACGAVQTQPTPLNVPDETVEVGGLAVVTQRRPTSGRLRARLIFGTGYEDVVPGAVATLAAWQMERGGVDAVVLPRRIELSAECASEQWVSCLSALAEAVSISGSLSPEAHAALRRRVRDSAQVARGNAAGRATVLAVGAAFGSFGQGPFEEGDGEALSIEAVQSYTRANVRLGNALLVLEGDLSGEPDPAIVAAALSTGQGDVSLRHPSFVSSAAIVQEDQVRVETGAEDAMSIALSYADPETAKAVASWLSSEVVGDEDTDIRLFRARAGAIVLVRTPPDRGALLIAQVAQHRFAPLDWRMSPIEAWLAQRSIETSRGGMRVGVGLVCLERDGRDLAACRAQYLQFERRPLSFVGEQTEDIADGELGTGGDSRGAHLSIRRQPGELGAVFLWRGGSAEDAIGAHGAHALLALVLAQRCRATPIVRPEVFGVSRRLAANELSSFAACITRPVTSEEWSRARESAAAFVADIPERAWLAQHGAPSAPGWMIPEGSAQGIADAPAGAWTGDARSLDRLRVGLVGELDVDASIRVLSETLSALPASPVLSASTRNSTAGNVTPAPSSFSLVTEEHDAANSRVVVLWRGPGGQGNVPLAARAFVSAAELRLREEGWSVRWADGGGDAHISWAAVALDLDDRALDVLPRVLATLEVDPQSLSGALASEQAEGTAAVVTAYRLAHTGVMQVTAPSVAVLEGLINAAPAFIIGRRSD